MHPDLEKYHSDDRRSQIPGGSDFQMLFLYAADQINQASWHWLQYHFSRLPPTPFAECLVECCLDCELQLHGLGKNYVDQLATKRDPDYQAILQVLAEIFSVRQIFSCFWPERPTFEYEPAGTTGKRPELLARTSEERFLFEVKAPSLLDHQRQRATSAWQIPGRMLPREPIERLAAGEPITLPRDNPIKDFLISAEAKFADFPEESGANTLIIVWDDQIYEPITTLVNPTSGLLTEKSYYKDNSGRAVRFPRIDGVIAVRHLAYLVDGLAERSLTDRDHAFNFGGPDALPNVFFPTPWSRPVPRFILDGLRAIDYRDDRLQCMAEYHPQEVVIWY